MRKLNPTVLALIGGLVILLLIIAYFASGRNPDQDKLTDANLTQERASSPEKRCASKATYDLIKRELFRRAAELRGSDQGAYDKLAAYAVVRMENPVMEGENSDTGAIECSGSLSIDLPPGVAVVGGRRSLMSNIDYTIQPAADGTGDVILLKNADAILAPLATLARVGEQPDQSPVTGAADESPVEGVDRDVDTAESPSAGPGTSSSSPPSSPGRPSFDCDDARTKGELAVCADSGLSSLDVNMAAQYRRAMSAADPQQRAILQRTRDRFLAYRDSCPSRKCIGDAYVGRMREIRDIMEGRWQPR